MSTQEPNTPGFLGYLLAIVVSFVSCALVLMLPGLYAGESVGNLVLYLPVVVAVVAVVGSPVALVGATAAHLLCRDVRSQAVHVVVTGTLGCVLTLLYLGALSGGYLGAALAFLGGAVGVAAGFGRATVIPLVESRRRRVVLRPALGNLVVEHS